MPPAGFEPAIPVGDRPQTHASITRPLGLAAPRILELKLRLGHFIRVLSPHTPLNRRLDGAQEQSARYGEEKHLLPLRVTTPKSDVVARTQ